jgi:hypothetical protein
MPMIRLLTIYFFRENFLKTPIRPETVKKLVVSGNVDDLSHRLYVQHLREIQAKREYQLQKIGHDEQAFLLADIQAHEDEDTEESNDSYLSRNENQFSFHRNTSCKFICR